MLLRYWAVWSGWTATVRHYQSFKTSGGRINSSQVSEIRDTRLLTTPFWTILSRTEVTISSKEEHSNFLTVQVATWCLPCLQRHHSTFTKTNSNSNQRTQPFYILDFRLSTWRLYKSMERSKELRSIATSGSAYSSHRPSRSTNKDPRKPETTTGRASPRKRRKNHRLPTRRNIQANNHYKSMCKAFKNVRQVTDLQRWQRGPVSWSTGGI